MSMNTTSTELQDLVTGLLDKSEETESEIPASLVESFVRWMDADEVLDCGRDVEDFLLRAHPEQDAELVRDRVAALSSMIMADSHTLEERVGWKPLMYSSPGYGEVFLFLIDYLRDPNSESLFALYQFIRGYNNCTECRIISSSYDSAINFIADRWKSQAAERISQATHTAIPTVNRWLGGSYPSQANTRALGRLAEILYTLEVDCRLGEDGAESWLCTKNPLLGDTPLNYINSTGYWWGDDNFQQAVQKEYDKNNSYSAILASKNTII